MIEESDNSRKTMWLQGVEMCLEKVMGQIATLGIPVIKGTITGNNGTFIAIEGADFIAYKNQISEGSICVLDVKQIETEEGVIQPDEFNVQVRLGTTNTWLCASLENPESSEDEDFDEYDEDLLGPTVDAATIERVAAIVARTPGFGGLKNKQQRRDFTRPIAKEEMSEDVADYYISHIAEYAESFYDLGLIPMKAKQLKEEGKTIAEISKLMRITKQKAELAVGAEIPKYIIENLSAAERAIEV